MIRLKMMMGIARAESRLTRRLVRYWVFMILAALVGAFFYAQYSLLHYQFSSASATVGTLNPRFLISDIGFRYLFVFLVGIIFLGMDVRARDVRERMDGVLDALPCSNLELVFGKYIGVFVPSWIPLTLIILTLWAVGFIWGGSIQPHTMIYLLFWMAIPAFTLIIGIAYCVLLLVKHRGAASVLLLAIMAGIYAAFFFSPIWLAPATDMTGGALNSFPSDIIPEVITGEAMIQRIAVMLMGLGLLWMAAGFHPRKDDGKFAQRFGVGLLLISVAAATLGGIVLARKNGIEERLVWKTAHEARLNDPVPNMTSITGEVVVNPGESLALDLEIGCLAGQGESLESALFSLNPGILVKEAKDGQDRPVSFNQENGLLDFKLNETLASGESSVVRFTAEGIPEQFFGFLDGAH
ncbi:MAG: ABC-2 transporter permease, partial [Acidobacteria bacterium]|nr:ABC-2 transporter permease [Candidatus Polarisedimenticola svalbardensis]